MKRYHGLALLLLVIGARHVGWVPAFAALGTTGAAQVFSTPKGEAQNVRFEQVAGGTVHIFYDLISSDPRAVFEVSLEASQDAGKTWSMRPKTVSGDVGAGIKVGPGKRIVWDSGKDVERLVIDQFRFRINAQAGPLEPQRSPAVSASPTPAAPAPKTGAGGVAIVSDPAGAQVRVDGAARGDTPLTIDDLAPGAHKVVISKAGYLDNSRDVTIVAGERGFVNVRLTPDQRTAPTPGATPPPPANPGGGGGGAGKWIAIAGGAAAAGVAVALSGGGETHPPPTANPPTTTIPSTPNRPPTITSNAAAPGGGLLAAATQVTFEVFVTDADGDPLTATWTFGDGTTASATISGGRGATTKVFNNAGGYTPTVTVTDGRGGSVSANYGTVNVGTVTGLWVGRLGPANCGPPSGGCYTIRVNLVQNGSAIAGDYEDQFGRGSRVQGIVRDPRGITISVTVGPHPIPGGGGSITFRLDGNTNLQTFSGNAGDSPVVITR